MRKSLSLQFAKSLLTAHSQSNIKIMKKRRRRSKNKATKNQKTEMVLWLFAWKTLPSTADSCLQFAVVHTAARLLTLGFYFYVSSLWKVEVMTEHWRRGLVRGAHMCCLQSRFAHPSVALLHSQRTPAAVTKYMSNRFPPSALLSTVVPLDIFTLWVTAADFYDIKWQVRQKYTCYTCVSFSVLQPLIDAVKYHWIVLYWSHIRA